MKNQTWIKYELNTWIEAKSGFGNTIIFKNYTGRNFRDYCKAIICDANGNEHNTLIDFNNYCEIRENKDVYINFHLKPNEKIKITDLDTSLGLEYDIF